MFILSRSEVAKLGGKEFLATNPVDTGAYFFSQWSTPEFKPDVVSNRNYWRRDHSMYDRLSVASTDSINKLRRMFAAELVPRNRDQDFKLRRYEAVHFAPDGSAVQQYEYRQALRLSTSLLVWPAQLEAWGVKPEPGYLYLLVPPVPTGRLTYDDMSFLDFEPEPAFEVNWNEKTQTLTAKLDSMPRGILLDVEHWVNGREIALPNVSIPEPAMHIQHGGMKITEEHALEMAHHQHVIRRRCYRDQSMIGERFEVPHYARVVKTPFEFTPGLVMQTASFLSELRGFRRTAFVQSFFDFAFSDSTLTRAQRAAKEADASSKFPRGEAKLSGADVAWRYSDDPWLVQLILFARLIGGRDMLRVLGSLALGFGKQSIDWDSPIFKTGEVSVVQAAPSTRRRHRRTA